MGPASPSKERPVVSIIMPAYNAEKYISESVCSVFEQTLTNWELIIVNDGSDDGTQAYLDTLTDDRIKIICQYNRGVSAARNAGLDVVQGEFVAFLDADDILTPISLEARVKYFQLNPEVDVVDGIVSLRNENLTSEVGSYQPLYTGELFPRLIRLDNRAIWSITYMLKSSQIGNLRFNEGMTHAEDLLFYMNFSCVNRSKSGHVGETIYLYRNSSGSAMSNMDGIERGFLKLIEGVGLLSCPSTTELLMLRIKISKVLFLCWISRRKYYRSLASVVKTFFLNVNNMQLKE